MSKGDGLKRVCVENVQRSAETATSDGNQIQSREPEMRFLPPEVWNAILGKIDDPQTILMCCEVCEEWNWILKHKKASAYHELMMPHLVPYLGTHDLLSCSCVSRNWNNWLDSSILNFRKKHMFWDEGLNKRLPTLSMSLDLDPPKEIDQFLAAKEGVVGCQFDNSLTYRHVWIQQPFPGEVMTDEEFDTFCSFLLRFLRRVGKYIYQLEIWNSSHSGRISVNRIIQNIRILTICLSNTNTPNLEVFNCQFTTCWNWDEFDENEDLQQVDAYLAESPLPNSAIRKLRMGDVPKKIIEVLIQRYGNQLVYIHDFFEIPFTTLISRGVTFENIKVLHGFVFLRRCVYYQGRLRACNDDDQPEIRDLDSLTNVFRILKCALTEVNIYLQKTSKYSELSYSKFFQAVQEYRPLIQKFRLSFY